MKLRKTKYNRWVNPTNSDWDRIIHILDSEFKLGEFKLKINLDNGESLWINFKKGDDLILISKVSKEVRS